eukprot:gnl/TRDRNA2_/TRDRNA2_154988_c0_seq1.p1 gnl/TRDRNA2_/TRDRNA2_154988_c0~~gnl/TRDRNA2_/TRDRNA2_154988_c0_seq1.p1  ORF type:complete len:388 (-),score=89.47 gnl/TRDRNA2_/TRDRNA2_154988_c0_seq1:3-1166(-)
MQIWGGKLVWNKKDKSNAVQAQATAGSQVFTSTLPGMPDEQTSDGQASANVPKPPSVPAPGYPPQGNEPLLSDMPELSEQQLQYIEMILQPLLAEMIREVVSASPRKPGPFCAAWLLGHLRVPRAIANPVLTFLKHPTRPVLSTGSHTVPGMVMCDREAQTEQVQSRDSNAAPGSHHREAVSACSQETQTDASLLESAPQVVAEQDIDKDKSNKKMMQKQRSVSKVVDTQTAEELVTMSDANDDEEFDAVLNSVLNSEPVQGERSSTIEAESGDTFDKDTEPKQQPSTRLNSCLKKKSSTADGGVAEASGEKGIAKKASCLKKVGVDKKASSLKKDTQDSKPSEKKAATLVGDKERGSQTVAPGGGRFKRRAVSIFQPLPKVLSEPT